MSDENRKNLANGVVQLRWRCAGAGKIVTDDKAPARFEGIKLITVGEAKGHGIEIDAETLRTLLEAANEKGRVSAYLTHDGALWGDRLGQEIGLFETFKIDGDSVRGNFRFLESFQKHEAAKYDKLVELAKEMPENFGVSVVASGPSVWVMQDGEEITARYDDERPDGATNAQPAWRVSELMSADFVDFPAANVGLLREKTNNNNGDKEMSDKENLLKLQKEVADLTKEQAATDKENQQLKEKVQLLNTQLTESHENALKLAGEYIAEGQKHATVNGAEIAIEALKAGDDKEAFCKRLLDAYTKRSDADGGQTPEGESAVDVDSEPADFEAAAKAYKQLRTEGRAADAAAYFRKHHKFFR